MVEESSLGDAMLARRPHQPLQIHAGKVLEQGAEAEDHVVVRDHFRVTADYLLENRLVE